MKKNIFLLVALISLMFPEAFASIKDDIIPNAPSIYNWTNVSEDLSLLDKLFVFVKDSIFGLLVIVSIWMFLYVWFKLLTARWNPEEFKKAMNSFLYIVIWIFITSLALAIVKLIAWITL